MFPVMSQISQMHTITAMFCKIHFQILQSILMSPLQIFPSALNAFFVFPVCAMCLADLSCLDLVILMTYGQRQKLCDFSLCSFLYLPY